MQEETSVSCLRSLVLGAVRAGVGLTQVADGLWPTHWQQVRAPLHPCVSLVVPVELSGLGLHFAPVVKASVMAVGISC